MRACISCRASLKPVNPGHTFVEPAHTIRLAVDRSHAESALTRATGLLSATPYSIPDGILVADPAGKIARYNREVR